MTDVWIDGLDPADLLAALYNRARPQGMGFAQHVPGDWTAEQAGAYLEERRERWHASTGEWLNVVRFDYLLGRVLKVAIPMDTTGQVLDVWLYDRDNGPGAAATAIDQLRRP